MKKKYIIIAIICLIIIAGVVVWKTQGFNKELQYSSRKQIQLGNSTRVDINDVEEIYAEVVGNDTRHFIQEVEIFGNSVSIVSENMTEEQRDQIVDKFNEKYNGKLEKDKVPVISIGFTRVKDVLKNYILPAGIITIVVILIYFFIRFKNIGWKKVLLKTVGIPVLAELFMFSLIAICRIPFGRISLAIGVGIYVATIAILTNNFENERKKLQENESKA